MIIPINTVWHLVSAFMVFIGGLFLFYFLAKIFSIKLKIIIPIYVWHSLFSLIYMYFSLKIGADSVDYYLGALSYKEGFSVGTGFIKFSCYILIYYLDFSYAGVFLTFNLVGSIGLFLFYASLKSITQYSSKFIKILVLLIVFLPSVSFWSSAIGKDAISFLGVNLALWAALNMARRKFIMVLSVVLLLLVRPHIAGMIVIALGLSMLIGSKSLGLTKKIFISSIIFPVVIVLVPFAGKYAGVEDITNVTEVSSYIEDRQGKNMGGGSSLDITNMSLPVKIFTYLFRPLPYEAHSMMSLLSSIENTILLAFFLYTIRFVRVKQNTVSNHAFLWVYIFTATFFLSSMTANLGIAARQKWMIMPLLIYLLFSGISAYQLRKRRMS